MVKEAGRSDQRWGQSGPTKSYPITISKSGCNYCFYWYNNHNGDSITPERRRREGKIGDGGSQ